MKMLFFSKLLIVCALLFVFSGCLQDNNCPECFTPPESLQMRIIDKNTNEDLIYNGTYNADSIIIYYTASDSEQYVEHQVYVDSTQKNAILVSYQISWESAGGFREFFISYNSSEADTIYLNIEERHTECCTYFEWVTFEVNGAEPAYDIENNYYFIEK